MPTFNRSSRAALAARRSRSPCIAAVLCVATVGLAFALGGCATTGVSAPQVTRLTTTQYAPTQTVDVLDAAPAAAYARIASLSVDDPTGTATRSQLVAELVAAAQKLGANAVIVGAERRAAGSAVGFNPSGGQMQAGAASGPVTLTALAIRYTH